MVFSEAQVEHFREYGYLAVSNFWTKREVEAMQAELERLKQDGKLRNVATAGDGKTPAQNVANLQLCPMAPHSTFYRAMPFAPKVAEAVGQLIGGPVMLHLDQVFLKPGLHGAGTNWHQDNAYFKIDNPMMGTALWTAVHDATIANGTIKVIPGSFHTAYEHSRDPYSDHHIRCYPPEDEAVSLELPAGGAAFFAYGVAHATGGNTTTRERAGVALHFLNAAMDECAQGGFARGKRPFLSGPEASGGVREYGLPVAGTWDAEIEKALAHA